MRLSISLFFNIRKNSRTINKGLDDNNDDLLVNDTHMKKSDYFHMRIMLITMMIAGTVLAVSVLIRFF